MTRYFQRQPRTVDAFRIPLLGEPAKENIPSWLISRMSAGEVRVNSAGGLSAISVWGNNGCPAGDWILLNEHDEVEFCPHDRFIEEYAPLVT